MKSSNKRVENLCCHKIGNSEIKVFAENQISDNPEVRKSEFIFEIDSSTKKQLDFPIFDLYKIMGIVCNALNDYVENTIFKELNNINIFQIMIEAEGNTEKEIIMKDNLYDYHLNKLAKKFSEVVDEIFCEHTKDNLTHYLTFSRVASRA
jgi:hypothetical protein